VFLLVPALAFQDIAEPEHGSDSNLLDCCFESFAGSAVAEAYAWKAAVDHDLVPVVQVDHDLIQVFFALVHAVLLVAFVLDLILVQVASDPYPVPVLVLAASVLDLVHAQVTSKHSSTFEDSHSHPDFPTSRLPS
jgi:hypothetical protein